MCSTVKLASDWEEKGAAFKGHFVTYAKKISNFEFWKLAEVIRNIIDEWHRKSANWWTDDIYRSDLYPIYSWAISSRWWIGIFCKTPSNGGGCVEWVVVLMDRLSCPRCKCTNAYVCVCVSVSYKQCGSLVWGTRNGIKCHMNVYFWAAAVLIRILIKCSRCPISVEVHLRERKQQHNNNKQKKAAHSGGSRKSWGREREEGEEKQTNLSCDILLDFSFI